MQSKSREALPEGRNIAHWAGRRGIGADVFDELCTIELVHAGRHQRNAVRGTGSGRAPQLHFYPSRGLLGLVELKLRRCGHHVKKDRIAS